MPDKATDNEPQSIDEFDTFDQLARKLLTVSKREMDAADVVRKTVKRDKVTPPRQT
jgi:hypothetical protein